MCDSGERYIFVLKCLKLEISFAPQLRLSPSKAMLFPLILWCWDPVVIVQPECPGMGQLHVSPTHATGIP